MLDKTTSAEVILHPEGDVDMIERTNLGMNHIARFILQCPALTSALVPPWEKRG